MQFQTGSDVELAQAIYARLKEKFNHIVFSEGEFWFFDKTHWREIESHKLRLLVHTYDGKVFTNALGVEKIIALAKGRIDSIINELKSLASEKDFFVQEYIGINCASGFIEFDREGQPKLRSHDAKYKCRHTLPGSWAEDAPDTVHPDSLMCELLDGVFKGDADADDKIKVLAEAAGSAALGYATRIRKPMAIVLKGETAQNGKSQVLDLIRGILPSTSICSLTPASMGKPTFIVALVGKLLNASDELSSSEAISSDVFKAVVTGEPVEGRDVYKPRIDFRARAQHVFATNVFPAFAGGIDRGVQRRLLVITFNRVIPETEIIENIGLRVGKEEPNLLLEWAVGGASRLIRQSGFTIPRSSTEALKEWLYGNDPVLAWASEVVATEEIINNSPYVRTSEAYNHFRLWAINEGFSENKLPAINGFVQRMKANVKGIEYRRTSTERLTTLLKDTGTNAQTFTPATFAYTVNGLSALKNSVSGNASGHSYVIQKSDGSIWLLVWNEPPLWNYTTHTDMVVAPTVVQINLPTAYSGTIYDPFGYAETQSTCATTATATTAAVTVGTVASTLNLSTQAGCAAANGLVPVTSFANTATVPVTLTDHLILVKLVPATTTSGGSAASCTDSKGTSHASGTTYTVQMSQTTGSIAATTAQCTYGGTQATTVTTTQSYSCTSGTQTAQGSATVTTVASGNPVCATAPINGACGSANGMDYAVAPTTGLCSVGSASAVGGANASEFWSWSCAGANGGTSASCSAHPLTVSISATAHQSAISPQIYGTNSNWTQVPQGNMATWAQDMQSLGNSFTRYPGGWDGECYDWNSYLATGVNQLLATNPSGNTCDPNSYTLAGASPDEYLQGVGTSMAKATSIVLPSNYAVQAATSADLTSAINNYIAEYKNIIGSRAGQQVTYYEIGNEWWNQSGGAGNLANYSALVAQAVPALKAQFPNIKLYVTADWTTAGATGTTNTTWDQFAEMMAKVSKQNSAAWALVDGIVIHPYCGTTVAQSTCDSIPAHVQAIISETGKTDIYASEWSVGNAQSSTNDGIENANETLLAYQDIAISGITKATYWPVNDTSQNPTNLMAVHNGSATPYTMNATGMLFGLMSGGLASDSQGYGYQGYNLPTSGDIRTVASRSSSGDVMIYVPTGGTGTQNIKISLAGTGLSKVVSSQVMYANTSSSYTNAYLAELPYLLVLNSAGNAVYLTLNPGTANRGNGWEIAVLHLK